MTNVHYTSFGKKEPKQTADAASPVGPAASVSKILRDALPLHPEKVRGASEGAKAFLAGLREVSIVELHLSYDSVDGDSYICSTVSGKNIQSFLPLEEFLDLLTETPNEGRSYSLDELIVFLEAIFQRISIMFEEVYFSPREYKRHKVEEPWSRERLDDTLTVPAGHFYTIATIDLGNEGLGISPSSHGDLIPNAKLIYLVASYLEMSYEDSIKTYHGTTMVEIMRYDYSTRTTHTMRIDYKTLERDCLAVIRRGNHLLRYGQTPSDVISVYLDRLLSREVDESKVIEFPIK